MRTNGYDFSKATDSTPSSDKFRKLQAFNNNGFLSMDLWFPGLQYLSWLFLQGGDWSGLEYSGPVANVNRTGRIETSMK